MTDEQIEASRHLGPDDPYDDVPDDVVRLAGIRYDAAHPAAPGLVPHEAAPGLTFLLGIIDEQVAQATDLRSKLAATGEREARYHEDAALAFRERDEAEERATKAEQALVPPVATASPPSCGEDIAIPTRERDTVPPGTWERVRAYRLTFSPAQPDPPGHVPEFDAGPAECDATLNVKVVYVAPIPRERSWIGVDVPAHVKAEWRDDQGRSCSRLLPLSGDDVARLAELPRAIDTPTREGIAALLREAEGMFSAMFSAIISALVDDPFARRITDFLSRSYAALASLP